MSDENSESHFVLADNMIHIVRGGTMICTGESDSNVKYDPSANLFATYCPICQSRNN